MINFKFGKKKHNISARGIHKLLGCRSGFRSWMRYIKLGLVEGEDYIVSVGNRSTRGRKDYLLNESTAIYIILTSNSKKSKSIIKKFSKSVQMTRLFG